MLLNYWKFSLLFFFESMENTAAHDNGGTTDNTSKSSSWAFRSNFTFLTIWSFYLFATTLVEIMA